MRRAVLTAVRVVSGERRGGRVFRVNPSVREFRAGGEDILFRGADDADLMLPDHREDFVRPRGLPDRDPFRHRGLRGNGDDMFGALRDRFGDRRAVRALDRDHLREVIDRARGVKVLKRLHGTDKERPVPELDKDVFGHPVQLLKDLVNVGLRSFIEEGIENVVRVVRAFIPHLRAADIGAVITVTRHHHRLRPERLDHRDLFRARAFRHVDLTFNPSARPIGRDRDPGVAGRVLHALLDPDRLHMGDERCSPAVLEGQGRHHVIHF